MLGRSGAPTLALMMMRVKKYNDWVFVCLCVENDHFHELHQEGQLGPPWAPVSKEI